jgi:hypothetical protein
MATADFTSYHSAGAARAGDGRANSEEGNASPELPSIILG